MRNRRVGAGLLVSMIFPQKLLLVVVAAILVLAGISAAKRC